MEKAVIMVSGFVGRVDHLPLDTLWRMATSALLTRLMELWSGMS